MCLHLNIDANEGDRSGYRVPGLRMIGTSPSLHSPCNRAAEARQTQVGPCGVFHGSIQDAHRRARINADIRKEENNSGLRPLPETARLGIQHRSPSSG